MMDSGHLSFVGCPTPFNEGLEVYLCVSSLGFRVYGLGFRVTTLSKGYVWCVLLLVHHAYKLSQHRLPPAHSMTQGWCPSYAHNGKRRNGLTSS